MLVTGSELDLVVRNGSSSELQGSNANYTAATTPRTLWHRYSGYRGQVLAATVNFPFVKAADRDDDGIGIPANAILLNGGSIRGSRGQDIALTHTAVADDPGRKVNGRLDVVPTIARVSVTGRPRQGDTYRRGESLLVIAVFSEPVEVTGTLQLTMQVGSQTRQADLHDRRGVSLLFEYVVQSSDVDADGFSVPADALTLNGGSIRDADGNAADLTHDALADDPQKKVNGAASVVPTVTRVSTFALPANQGTYAAGESIFAQVLFSADVLVTGSPQFTLQVGARERRADHLPLLRAAELPLGGSGVHTPDDARFIVYFEYVVQPSDVDDNGVSVPADALTLNGGSIRALVDGSDARLSHDGLPDAPGIKVDGGDGDGEAPIVLGLFVEPPPRGTFDVDDVIALRLRLSESVNVTIRQTLPGARRVRWSEGADRPSRQRLRPRPAERRNAPYWHASRAGRRASRACRRVPRRSVRSGWRRGRRFARSRSRTAPTAGRRRSAQP